MYDKHLFKGADGHLFHFASTHRKGPTAAEKKLWSLLRNRQLNGFKFRRQHPISNFIVDFFCPECRLVIEVDGAYHDEKTQAEYDAGRTFELGEHGLRIIRFTNEEVVNKIEFVIEEILKHLSNKADPKRTHSKKNIR